jgi:hypothetical protein
MDFMIITEAQLKHIISESIKKILREGDLFPNGIEITPARTAWEGIANALVNIQQYMGTKKQDFEREYNFSTGEFKDITEADVKELVDYIDLTINNVLSVSLPNIRNNK